MIEMHSLYIYIYIPDVTFNAMPMSFELLTRTQLSKNRGEQQQLDMGC